MKKMPIICPSCDHKLEVTKLFCSACETEVSGKFSLPIFLQLSQEEQAFILQFFLSSGSLKDMAKQLDVSYPTMRNKVDDLIEKVNLLKEKNEK